MIPIVYSISISRLLYDKDEHPNHCVVIKHVPYVADSKRAMDEYTSEIFMGSYLNQILSFYHHIVDYIASLDYFLPFYTPFPV